MALAAYIIGMKRLQRSLLQEKELLSRDFWSSSRMTLVLFRTRRRDECSRLKKGVRRRVRKSRQKEAAGAADAGLMQIEWREGGVEKLAGVVKAGRGEAGAAVRTRVDGRSELRRGQRDDLWA